MPFQKGVPRAKGAGRKKGGLNKDRIPLIDKCAELGCDPFEVLIRFAAGDWRGLGYQAGQKIKTIMSNGEILYEDVISPDLRGMCAKEACQYIYPKRKALEIDANVDVTLLDTINRLKELPDEELKKIVMDE